ncbi:MAG: TlpA family protein disulfide reductase, partial [Candidatus Heimdallarchaeaceae archaeon]
MKKEHIVTLIISFLIIGGAIGAYYGITSRAPKSSVAPDYTLQDIDGTSFKLSDFRNKTILLDFMSVTCVPCKQMYPILADLLNDSEINSTLEIISIEVDNTTALPVLQHYAVEHEITWYLAIAPVNMTSEYGVTTLPTFVIINPYGNIT